MITRQGTLLAGVGLDRRLGLVFRIEPHLLALVPENPDAITDAEVVEALRFLVDEWLCDIAAGFTGRLVLIAYALTLIERPLLPERPAFFVTAGQRGGGKTTTLMMVVLASPRSTPVGGGVVARCGGTAQGTARLSRRGCGDIDLGQHRARHSNLLPTH